MIKDQESKDEAVDEGRAQMQDPRALCTEMPIEPTDVGPLSPSMPAGAVTETAKKFTQLGWDASIEHGNALIPSQFPPPVKA